MIIGCKFSVKKAQQREKEGREGKKAEKKIKKIEKSVDKRGMAWYYIQAVTQTAAAEAVPVFGNLLQAANFKIHLEGNEKKREPSEQDSPLALKKVSKRCWQTKDSVI